MKKRKKERDILRHVRRSFRVRWDIDLTDELHRQFVQQINKGRCRLIEKQSNRISVWGLVYNDEEMSVVYDKQRKMLVTVLPKGADISDRYLYDKKFVLEEL